MVYKDKEKIKDYGKIYREANKEKKKAYDKIYRKVNKEKIKDYLKVYREANREELKTKNKTYKEANKEKIYAVNKAYREANKEKIKAQKRIYKKNNRASHNARNAKRKADKIKATPLWANLEKIKEIYKNCPKGYHVDHVIPLKSKYVCGLHVENNLQYLTAKENIVKSNKIIDKYI